MGEPRSRTLISAVVRSVNVSWLFNSGVPVVDFSSTPTRQNGSGSVHVLRWVVSKAMTSAFMSVVQLSFLQTTYASWAFKLDSNLDMRKHFSRVTSTCFFHHRSLLPFFRESTTATPTSLDCRTCRSCRCYETDNFLKLLTPLTLK